MLRCRSEPQRLSLPRIGVGSDSFGLTYRVLLLPRSRSAGSVRDFGCEMRTEWCGCLECSVCVRTKFRVDSVEGQVRRC